MNTERLRTILDGFPKKRIAVFGDFFLDKYLEIDPALDEISIETGLTAYQVTGKRLQAGAAGTVCNNLAALGVGTIETVGVIGDDGEGYDLKAALDRIGADASKLIVTPDRFTPTYTKPMVRRENGEEELNRQDIKNRTPLPADLEDLLIQQLRETASRSGAVIVADQVQERNCGVVTDRLRGTLAELADEFPAVLFFCDSRERIGEFSNVTVKPNRFEAARAAGAEPRGEIPADVAIGFAETLRLRTGKPVYLTLDKEGIRPVTGGEDRVIPCPPVNEPIDIVGAGDSVTAGMVSALVAGANPLEAALIGNLVASVTIRQLGTTGTASPQQVLAAWEANREVYEGIV